MRLLETRASDGARIVCFADYFLTATPTKDTRKTGVEHIAGPIPGPTIETFAEAARRLNLYVVAGTILPEIGEDQKIYSPSAFRGPDGTLLGKVRKTHPEKHPPCMN